MKLFYQSELHLIYSSDNLYKLYSNDGLGLPWSVLRQDHLCLLLQLSGISKVIKSGKQVEYGQKMKNTFEKIWPKV